MFQMNFFLILLDKRHDLELSHLAAIVRSSLVVSASFGQCRGSLVPWSSPLPVVYPKPLCLHYFWSSYVHELATPELKF